MSLISDIIEYTVISAPAEKLQLDKFSTRLQLNSMLIAPFGSGKSSLLYEIESKGVGEVLTDYTLAGLVGSIKGGKLIKGFVIKVAGKCLMIDEFQKFKKKERDAILNLMEHHRFSRSLAGEVPTLLLHDSKYSRVYTSENYLNVYARSSYLIATMYFSRKREEDHALLSRVFPIPVLEERGMANNLLSGRPIFFITKDLIKEREILDGKSVYSPESILQKLMSYSEQYRKHDIKEGYIIRGIMDILRIAGINAILESRDIVNVDDLDLAVKYIPLQIVGYKHARLTPTQIKILDYIYNSSESTVDSISNDLGMNRDTVDNCVRILEKLKLIRRYSISGKYVIYPME